MKSGKYQENVARFERLVREKRNHHPQVALIVDSPWLPGYAGISMLDFYFDPAQWLAAYERAHRNLPDAVFIPDVWVEFGMAAEPSGWGVPIHWSGNTPPAILPRPGGLTELVEAKVPDPETDGLMPIILRRYETLAPELEKRGMPARMAATRGPLAVSAHLLGLTEFLMVTQLDTDRCERLLNKVTELCIRWLKSQLQRMTNPIGVLILDDVVGMLSPTDASRWALPYLKQIFAQFPDLIHIYHNDTPNEAILPTLSQIGMDVYNFSYEMDITRTRQALGDQVVLMGNISPLDVLMRGTIDEVKTATTELMHQVDGNGPILISPGGGVSPETPLANLQAMVEVATNWNNNK